MSSRRVLKVASAIREVVGMAILTELRDPRIRDVTVTRVEVTSDLQQAKVYVSVMGDETKQNLSLRGLQSAAGHLQSLVNRRIEMRYTPRLVFVLDKGVKNAAAIDQILREVLPHGVAEEGEELPDEELSAEELSAEELSAEELSAEELSAEERGEAEFAEEEFEDEFHGDSAEPDSSEDSPR